MKTGWFKISESKYIPVRMVAGPYPWGNAVRLRCESGEEIITTLDSFLAERPLTPEQIAAATRRAAWSLAREEKALNRAHWCGVVRAVLDTGPRTLQELHEATGYSYPALYQRICYWPEFADVLMTGGKYHYDH